MAIFNRKKKPEEATDVAEQREPTIEEQMMRRQSAPQPNARGYLREQMAAQNMQGGIKDGFKALEERIGTKQIQEANLTLQRYKEAT